MLKKVVDRGHPPGGFGTFPSGGTSRVIAVYAAVLILAIMLMPALSRAWRAGLWTGLVTAGVVEAFTRVYLSLHWLTDALFALPFGTVLLLTNTTAITAISYRRRVATPAESDSVQPTRHRKTETAAPS
jgi:membrane-associated phospholipid phosphatase